VPCACGVQPVNRRCALWVALLDLTLIWSELYSATRLVLMSKVFVGKQALWASGREFWLQNGYVL
jgi:hypothetical protein